MRHWLKDTVRERCVALGELREGLGRLVFVSGQIEHIRPILGPLIAWASAGVRFVRPRLPTMLPILMEFLATELEASYMLGCREESKERGELFRLDAKAEGSEVAIGGWLCDGGRATRDAPWFALKLTHANAAWAFARGGHSEPLQRWSSWRLSSV